MRVAAVAFVLVIGAAVVLVFANTLNTWVLGGLLGGLAALLISIPISLALFTLLTRRHETRQRMNEPRFEDEPDFVEDPYYDETIVYEAENSLPAEYDEFSDRSRSAYPQGNRHQPVSGYLRLPPPGPGRASDEEVADLATRREPRSYPRQPRSSSYDREPRETGTRSSQSIPLKDSRRNPSTRSLAQHQSEALRMARQEAQQRYRDDERPSGPVSRRQPTTDRSQYSLRPRPDSTQRSRRPTTDRDSGRFSARQSNRRAWEEEDEMFSEDLSAYEQRERNPRSSAYPRRPRSARPADPWTGPIDEEYDEDEEFVRRPRRDTDRQSGNLRNPLVRRAPYLYEDDPLREEFSQQLDSGRPITRRSSRHEDDYYE